MSTPQPSDVLQLVPLAVPAFVCLFIGLFAYDVYRTRSASDGQQQQPARMLSELAFNGLMQATLLGFACALVRGVVEWARAADGATAAATIVAGVAALGVGLVATRRAAELPADSVPDFLRCDGEFVAPPGDSLVNPLASWCGWIRFEGHGSCRVQRAAESAVAVDCTWHAHAGGLRIDVPLEGRPPHAVGELFVHGGDAEDGVDVSVSAAGPPVCRFTFVPEEAHNDA